MGHDPGGLRPKSVKHRLTRMWVVLWNDLGVRPSDVARMTLDDVLVVEIYADEAERQQRRARNAAARKRR